MMDEVENVSAFTPAIIVNIAPAAKTTSNTNAANPLEFLNAQVPNNIFNIPIINVIVYIEVPAIDSL